LFTRKNWTVQKFLIYHEENRFFWLYFDLVTVTSLRRIATSSIHQLTHYAKNAVSLYKLWNKGYKSARPHNNSVNKSSVLLIRHSTS